MSAPGVRTVYLFRAFEVVDRSGKPLKGIGQPASELLAYLLLNGEQPVRRERLMALLWPEVTDGQARRSLRQLLWRLRRHFCETSTGPDDIFIAEGDTIALDPAVPPMCDVIRFRSLGESATWGTGPTPSADERGALEAAIALYRGDLLEGWEQGWCWIEREALRALYLRMLDRLMDLCALEGAYDRGIAYGHRALRCDPASERAYRRLMRLHALRGDRSGALRLYALCREALADVLDVPPDRRTRALAAQILADEPEVRRLRGWRVRVGGWSGDRRSPPATGGLIARFAG